MPNPDEQKVIDELFTYHAPTSEHIARLQNVRVVARALATAIVENCPRSADRTAALRKLRESVMTANASIVLPQMPPVL
jgi:hypothetical protein